MKRILLFGATGRTGELILAYALEKGYPVTALVRNPSRLIVQSKDLSIVEGSPTNPEDVKKSMANCDIVISALSPVDKGAVFTFKKLVVPNILETSIQNTIESMMKLDKKRIITISSIGAGDSYRYTPWYVKLLIKFTNFKVIFAGHNSQEALLMNSGLDWTITRPAGLTDDTGLNQLVISFDKMPSPFKISRKLLARYIVDCIDDKTSIKKAPMLSELQFK
jgi:uncharacterized protein YbjT (DUF2867 family)